MAVAKADARRGQLSCGSPATRGLVLSPRRPGSQRTQPCGRPRRRPPADQVPSMLKRSNFFDSSQWTADRPREWAMRGLTLECSPDAHLALGAPQFEGTDEVCPGLGRAWRLESECGLQIVFVQALQKCADGSVEVLQTQVVTPFRSEGEHALRHLPFDAKVLSAADALDLATGWELSRLDDNGQRFVIGCYPRRESADCVASHLGSGGHKQAYVVRLVEPRPVMVSDTGEWELWRSDDAGNSFLVTRHLTRSHGQTHLDALEAQPARHKQVYWLARRGQGSTP
jgi:hypothetical protein